MPLENTPGSDSASTAVSTKPSVLLSTLSCIRLLPLPSDQKKPRGRTIGTIKRYLCAVRQPHEARGLDCARCDSRLHEIILRGAKKHSPSKLTLPSMPVTTSLLKALLRCNGMDLSYHDQQLLWAIMVTGVCGLFRSGELLPDAKRDPT